MTSRVRTPGIALRRVCENAGILIFASLVVMSIALGRYPGALVWTGALLVFFAHACEGRAASAANSAGADAGARASTRRYDLMRWCGLLLASIGAAAIGL